MEQRDILKDQIEQLGRVLGKILGIFGTNMTNGNINEMVVVTNQKLQEELKLDIDKLINFESDKLEEYVDTLKLTSGHLDQLSKYLYKVGISNGVDIKKPKSIKYLNSALLLLELVDNKSGTYSLKRNSLKDDIQVQLRDLKQN